MRSRSAARWISSSVQRAAEEDRAMVWLPSKEGQSLPRSSTTSCLYRAFRRRTAGGCRALDLLEALGTQALCRRDGAAGAAGWMGEGRGAGRRAASASARQGGSEHPACRSLAATPQRFAFSASSPAWMSLRMLRSGSGCARRTDNRRSQSTQTAPARYARARFFPPLAWPRTRAFFSGAIRTTSSRRDHGAAALFSFNGFAVCVNGPLDTGVATTHNRHKSHISHNLAPGDLADRELAMFRDPRSRRSPPAPHDGAIVIHVAHRVGRPRHEGAAPGGREEKGATCAPSRARPLPHEV